MKIAVYGDAHWSEYSSIVRKRGEKFSVRLENLITSISLVEDISMRYDCGCVINLGDFFDKPELNAEEITALNSIDWNRDAVHFNIIGNHEMGRNDLSTSSCDLFNLMPNNVVLYNQSVFEIDGCELAFLPYCLEEHRKPIELPKSNKKRILFSHNDILGIQMGQFVSKAGYSIEDIENNCDLCFNGHLHNGQKISNKIINVGNITGQNFSEDATKYLHGLYIVDTDTLEYEFIENQFAFNFYKLDWKDAERLSVKPNAVCSIKCKQNEVDEVKQWFLDNQVQESRITIQPDIVNVDSITDVEDFAIDHLEKFREFVLANMENTDILLEELAEVSK